MKTPGDGSAGPSMPIACRRLSGHTEVVGGRGLPRVFPVFIPMPSYQTIFFVMSLLCALPVVIWYYRRHSHPRFRPKVGEMVMVTLFAGLLCLGGSMLIGGLMDDPEQFRPDASMSIVPSMPGESSSGDSGSDRDESSKKSDSGSRSGSRRGNESTSQERR